MSKKTTIILIIVLVIVAGILFWSMKKGTISNVDTNTGQSSESTEDTSAGSINAGASAATMSYASAISKYKGARLELDQDCKANPKNLTLQNNSFLLIDNQSSSDRVVKVGTLMNIRANSFKIVNVESATSGPTWNIDCDQSTNVATVLIQ